MTKEVVCVFFTSFVLLYLCFHFLLMCLLALDTHMNYINVAILTQPKPC